MVSGTLIIDRDKCVGCRKCITRLYRHRDKRTKEVDDPYFECYRCFAVCPKGAIPTQKFLDFEDMPIGQCLVSYDNMISFLGQKRSIRWFTKEKVSREKFGKLFKAGHHSLTAMHTQGVEFAVIDNRLDDFIQVIYESLKPIESSFPRISATRKTANPLARKCRTPMSKMH